VVARRTGGAARALYEPLLATLRDLGSPAVLLSGSPAEGPLFAGVKAQQARPGRALWARSHDSVISFQTPWSDR
jgi:S-DNA-T family DNA segregation ATPase FtsK/SpoIIIE